MFARGARLLIVDDAACVRSTISLVLAEVGYRVRSAEDGFSALREIRQEVPDIILCDLNMPGMSGFELLRVVRHRFPAIMLIAMSGSFSGNEVPSGVAADAFYPKGSSIGALLQIFMTPHALKRPASESPRTSAPLSIRCNGNESTETEQVTIACPECMRTFAKAVEGPINVIREMDCLHCGNRIQYTIVTAAERAAPFAFQHPDNLTNIALNPSTLTS